MIPEASTESFYKFLLRFEIFWPNDLFLTWTDYVINCIWMLMDKSDCLHSNLPGFKRVICIGTKFTSISLSIAITDGVAMEAHCDLIQVIFNTCSAIWVIATIFSISEGINKKRDLEITKRTCEYLELNPTFKSLIAISCSRYWTETCKEIF